jgi:hypothetical protein
MELFDCMDGVWAMWAITRQETLMGMELFGDCMDFWSFVYERTAVRAGIFPKKIFSLANSSKLRGKWNHLAILRYCVQ